jgi:hypothetical protein
LGELGYANATITLDTSSTSQTITTDLNGNYSISDLTLGSYSEILTLPNGYSTTTANPVDLIVSANTTQNFGIVPLPTPTNTPTPTSTPTPTPANVAPIVGAIAVSADSIFVNTPINANALFTDANTTDTHTASWNWGDGTTTGTVTESNGSGTVSNNHTYTQAGIYTITLIVADNHDATGTSTYLYINVSDPSAGWVKGDKHFNSPAGAVVGNPSATGVATFGFTARYSGGYLLPVGHNWASLDFSSGSTNITFNATSYSSLVITGTKLFLRGTGTYNNVPGYSVFVSGIDNGNGNAIDYVRYQIKNPSGIVVYDTQPEAVDTADPTTAVNHSGKIQIH